MRQYQVFYRRGGSKYALLEPGVHAPIYDREVIREAVNILRTNPKIEGLAVREGDEMFNLIVRNQGALALGAFSLEIGGEDAPTT